MKWIRIIISVFLLSLLYVQPSFADGLTKEELVFNKDGSVKDGFLKDNPWSSKFKYLSSVEKQIQEEWRDSYQVVHTFSPVEAQEIAKAHQGIIKNDKVEASPPQNRPPFSPNKRKHRLQLQFLAQTGGAIGLPTASAYLLHSLQDKPPSVLNNVDSVHTEALRHTMAYTLLSQDILDKIKTGQDAVGGKSVISTSNKNAGMDFYLTYGHVSVEWVAVKEKKSWIITISISDVYDYHPVQDLGSDPVLRNIKLMNNLAAEAQKSGALVPYSITTMMTERYTP